MQNRSLGLTVSSSQCSENCPEWMSSDCTYTTCTTTENLLSWKKAPPPPCFTPQDKVNHAQKHWRTFCFYWGTEIEPRLFWLALPYHNILHAQYILQLFFTITSEKKKVTFWSKDTLENSPEIYIHIYVKVHKHKHAGAQFLKFYLFLISLVHTKHIYF